MLEQKKIVEGPLNKGSEAQQSSHGIEGKENVEALEEEKGELTMRQEKVCQE